MKRLCMFVCCLTLLCSLWAQPVLAGEAENYVTGQLGDHVTYILSGNSLHVEGEGAMWDFATEPHELDDWPEVTLDGKPSPL